MSFGWNASTDPNVAGYNIYYGTSSQVYTDKVSVGGATVVTISGLSDGTTYYFAATSYDTNGIESPFSPEISYTVPASVSGQPPMVATMSATNTALAGQNVTFSLSASGCTPIVYQWIFNNHCIAAATNATLTLSNVTVVQSGAYYAKVINAAGFTNTPAVDLTVYSTSSALLTPVQYNNGQFALSVSGVPDYSYVVQASTNLVDWTPVQTNLSPFTFVDSNMAVTGQCFFRAFCTSF